METVIWRDSAACSGYPTEWWFPLTPGDGDPRAIAICAGCPVTTECEQAGVGEQGMWGGIRTDRREARQRVRVTAKQQIRINAAFAARIMELLHRNGGTVRCTSAGLAERWGSTTKVVTRAVRVLERRNLITHDATRYGGFTVLTLAETPAT